VITRKGMLLGMSDIYRVYALRGRNIRESYEMGRAPMVCLE
jgi:hypothetical protein